METDICPRCRQRDTLCVPEGGRPGWEGKELSIKLDCIDCGAIIKETYSLIKQEIINEQ